MAIILTKDGPLKPGIKSDWCKTPKAGYLRMSKRELKS